MDEERPYKLDRRYCCICGNKRSDGKLFTVPKNEQLLKQWMQLLDREDILELDYLYVRQNARVCEAHFFEWSFASTERLKLIRFALPNIPNPLTSDLQKSKADASISRPEIPPPEILPVELAETTYHSPDTTSEKDSATDSQPKTTNGSQPNVEATPSDSQSKDAATSSDSQSQKAATPSGPKYKPKTFIIGAQHKVPAIQTYSLGTVDLKKPKVASPPKSATPSTVPPEKIAPIPPKPRYRSIGVQTAMVSPEEKAKQDQRSRDLKKLKNQKAEIILLEKRLEEIRQFGFLCGLRDNLTEEQFKFIGCLLKQSRRSKSGHRFDDEVKDFALKVHAESPKLYKFLRLKMALPSKESLKRYK